MATVIAVVGKSGTGKSTSMGNIPEYNIKGLDPELTVMINVVGKPLPFKGWKKLYNGKVSEGGNYVHSKDPNQITQVIKYVNKNRPDIKNIVIEDGQYIMAFDFMGKAKEEGYGKFAEVGVNMSNILSVITACREDLRVIFMWHPEKSAEAGFKMKTCGRMVDEYITLEGLFTVVLYSNVTEESGELSYSFVTNYNGEFPAKSPIGMFPSLEIPNDLGLVTDLITEYEK